MGKVSRRGLFGWLGAFAAAAPFVAVAARPTRLVNMFADYTPIPRYDLLRDAMQVGPGMHIRMPTNYTPIKVGDVVTFNDEPPRIVTAVIKSDG